jgi:hypothetical protein
MSHYNEHEEGDFDHERQNWCRGRKYHKPMGPGNPHIPNKTERQELARIMQKSGLTEEEVRKNKVHRQALAKASKSVSTSGNRTDRLALEIKRLRRRKARYLGVPVWDPKVDESLNVRTDNVFGRSEVDRVKLRLGFYR